MHTRRDPSAPRAVSHSAVLGPLGLMASMAVPAAIAVIGLVAQGADAIDWAGAIVWGVVATAVFTAFSMMGTAVGITRMGLLDLLDSVVARPGSGGSRALGAVMHHAGRQGCCGARSSRRWRC
jgi:hypothetical protein